MLPPVTAVERNGHGRLLLFGLFYRWSIKKSPAHLRYICGNENALSNVNGRLNRTQLTTYNRSARRSQRLSGALICHFWSNYLAHRCQWQPYIAKYPWPQSRTAYPQNSRLEGKKCFMIKECVERVSARSVRKTRPRKILCKLVEFWYQWEELHKILRDL